MNPQDVQRVTKEFFVQELAVSDYGSDRLPLFAERLAGKKVLHVGCADWPVFQLKTNLHLHLSGRVGELVGCDPDSAGIEALRTLIGGRYYLNLAEVWAARETFDVVLAPEVLEHIANPGEFLTELFQIPAREYVLTAPNYSYWERSTYDGRLFRELVHPDHKAWYSPYTLFNACRPHLHETDDVEPFFIGDRSTVGLWVKSSGRWASAARIARDWGSVENR